jgi:hypothetical protein
VDRTSVAIQLTIAASFAIAAGLTSSTVLALRPRRVPAAQR